MKAIEITVKPTDIQLDIFSYFKDYKDNFNCFLSDDSVIYEFKEGFIRLTEKDIKQKIDITT